MSSFKADFDSIQKASFRNGEITWSALGVYGTAITLFQNQSNINVSWNVKDNDNIICRLISSQSVGFKTMEITGKVNYFAKFIQDSEKDPKDTFKIEFINQETAINFAKKCENALNLLNHGINASNRNQPQCAYSRIQPTFSNQNHHTMKYHKSISNSNKERPQSDLTVIRRNRNKHKRVITDQMCNNVYNQSQQNHHQYYASADQSHLKQPTTLINLSQSTTTFSELSHIEDNKEDIWIQNSNVNNNCQVKPNIQLMQSETQVVHKNSTLVDYNIDYQQNHNYKLLLAMGFEDDLAFQTAKLYPNSQQLNNAITHLIRNQLGNNQQAKHPKLVRKEGIPNSESFTQNYHSNQYNSQQINSTQNQANIHCSSQQKKCGKIRKKKRRLTQILSHKQLVDPVRDNWKVGSKCQILSRSKWYIGTIQDITMDKKGEWLKVIFSKNDSHQYTKEVKRYDAMVKTIEEIKNNYKKQNNYNHVEQQVMNHDKQIQQLYEQFFEMRGLVQDVRRQTINRSKFEGTLIPKLQQQINDICNNQFKYIFYQTLVKKIMMLFYDADAIKSAYIKHKVVFGNRGMQFVSAATSVASTLLQSMPFASTVADIFKDTVESGYDVIVLQKAATHTSNFRNIIGQNYEMFAKQISAQITQMVYSNYINSELVKYSTNNKKKCDHKIQKLANKYGKYLLELITTGYAEHMTRTLISKKLSNQCVNALSYLVLKESMKKDAKKLKEMSFIEAWNYNNLGNMTKDTASTLNSLMEEASINVGSGKFWGDVWTCVVTTVN